MKLLQIDAFTSEPFRGNPAAVCLLDRERDASVDAERRGGDEPLRDGVPASHADDGWSLRWFTPAVEVDSAATPRSPARTRCGRSTSRATERALSHASGVLTAKRDGDLIELDFPAKREEPSDAPAGLLDALGVDERDVRRPQPVRLPRRSCASEDDRARAQARSRALRTIPVRGVIVTSRGTGDIRLRLPLLRARLRHRRRSGHRLRALLPHALLVATPRQERDDRVSRPRRAAASIRVRLDGDRVKLAGRAVTVLRGELLV